MCVCVYGDPLGPPSATRRVSSCALAELLGNTFEDARQAVPGLQKSSFHRAEEEMKMNNTAVPLPLSGRPINWWKKHHGEYPLLAKLAKWHLCVPRTSISADPVFSTAGDTVMAQRSSLTMEQADSCRVLVFAQVVA